MASVVTAALLQAAVAQHIGAPGTIHNLAQLTGGANRTTWAFEADTVRGRERLILQQSSAATASTNPMTRFCSLKTGSWTKT